MVDVHIKVKYVQLEIAVGLLGLRFRSTPNGNKCRMGRKHDWACSSRCINDLFRRFIEIPVDSNSSSFEDFASFGILVVLLVVALSGRVS